MTIAKILTFPLRLMFFVLCWIVRIILMIAGWVVIFVSNFAGQLITFVGGLIGLGAMIITIYTIVQARKGEAVGEDIPLCIGLWVMSFAVSFSTLIGEFIGGLLMSFGTIISTFGEGVLRLDFEEVICVSDEFDEM